MLIVLTILSRVFGRKTSSIPGNLANILYQASFVAIIAVPMTLVLISGNFDLSVAATAAISAACVLLLSDQIGIFPAMAISLVPGLLVGLINAAVVQGLGINAFIVTLATMTALRGVLLIITGGPHRLRRRPRRALAAEVDRERLLGHAKSAVVRGALAIITAAIDLVSAHVT